MPSPEFELSTIEIEKINGVLNNDELLELYAYFKVASGADISQVPKPGMFDMKGKAKYNAWAAKADLSAEEGEKEYIKLVEQLKAKHGYDATRTKKADNSPIEAAKLAKFDELSKQLGKNQ